MELCGNIERARKGDPVCVVNASMSIRGRPHLVDYTAVPRPLTGGVTVVVSRTTVVRPSMTVYYDEKPFELEEDAKGFHGQKGEIRMGTSCIIHFFAQSYHEAKLLRLEAELVQKKKMVDKKLLAEQNRIKAQESSLRRSSQPDAVRERGEREAEKEAEMKAMVDDLAQDTAVVEAMRAGFDEVRDAVSDFTPKMMELLGLGTSFGILRGLQGTTASFAFGLEPKDEHNSISEADALARDMGNACDFAFGIKDELLSMNKQRAVLNLPPIHTYTVIKTGEVQLEPKGWTGGACSFGRVDRQDMDLLPVAMHYQTNGILIPASDRDKVANCLPAFWFCLAVGVRMLCLCSRSFVHTGRCPWHAWFARSTTSSFQRQGCSLLSMKFSVAPRRRRPQPCCGPCLITRRACRPTGALQSGCRCANGWLDTCLWRLVGQSGG